MICEDYFYSIIVFKSPSDPLLIDSKSGIMLGPGNPAELLKKLFDGIQEQYPNGKVVVISFNKV